MRAGLPKPAKRIYDPVGAMAPRVGWAFERTAVEQWAEDVQVLAKAMR